MENLRVSSIPNRIRLGISACLVGQNVRYSGGHTGSRFCQKVLSEVFKFEAFCPEVSIGLEAPREAIGLVGDFNSPKAHGSKISDFDLITDPYSEQTAQRMDTLPKLPLQGDKKKGAVE